MEVQAIMSEVFAQRLRAELEEASMPQHGLAAEVGVSPSAVTKWLGGTLPSGLSLVNICRVLGISADWLLGLSDDRSRVPTWNQWDAAAAEEQISRARAHERDQQQA